MHTALLWCTLDNTFLFLLGEKHFDTVHDLVEDGLITMYVEVTESDYISAMTLTKAIQRPFIPSDCEKAHNFVVNILS